MKKTVLLAALALLGSIVISCDNDTISDNAAEDTYATDDGLIPLNPAPPPPPVPPKPPKGRF